MMNKRASFMDNLAVFIFIIIIVLVMVLCMFTLSGINSQFSASGAPTVATTSLNNFTTKFNGIADGSIILFLIILWVGTMITSFFLESYPVFFVIFITLSVVSFFILAPLTNVIVTFMEDSNFATIVASLPLTSFVLNHLLTFNAFFILSIGLVLYAKFKR